MWCSWDELCDPWAAGIAVLRDMVPTGVMLLVSAARAQLTVNCDAPHCAPHCVPHCTPHLVEHLPDIQYRSDVTCADADRRSASVYGPGFEHASGSKLREQGPFAAPHCAPHCAEHLPDNEYRCDVTRASTDRRSAAVSGPGIEHNASG